MRRIPKYFSLKKVRVRNDTLVQKGKQRPTKDLERVVIEKMMDCYKTVLVAY